MIDPHVHLVDVEQFESWLASAPPGQWCSYKPAWPNKGKSDLTMRVGKSYEDKKVLTFQQRRGGRAEYLACRVSRETWENVEAASRLASATPMAAMKAKIQDYLAGRGAAA